MRYFLSRLNEQAREREYRNYVTDVLRIGFGINLRYADMWEPVETRTADEIKESIKSKLRDIEVSNGRIQLSGEDNA